MISKVWYRLFLLFPLISSFLFYGTRSSTFGSKQYKSWETFPLPLISGGVISQLIADAKNANHIYGLQEQTGEWQTIVESNDAGGHWHSLANLQRIWIHSLTIDPVRTNVLYIGSDTGIYRSENGGSNWMKVADFGPQIAIPTADTLYSIEKLPGSPECPIGQSKFVRSYNRGNTWEKIPLPCGEFGEISIWQSNPRFIYIRGSDPLPNGTQMLLHSIDGGDTWSFLALTGPLFTMGIFSVAIDPDDPEKLYSSSGTGIITSADGGQTWHSILEIPITGSFLFSFINDEIYAGLVSTLTGAPGAVYRSCDGGDTWEQLPAQLPSNLKALLTNSNLPDMIYIGLDGYGIRRSSDRGRNWQSMNTGLLSTTKTARLMISLDPSHQIFAIADWPRRALFKSSNGGLSWSSPLSEAELYDIASDPSDASLIWAVGPEGWVKSENGGVSWQSVSPSSGTNLAISPAAPDRPCATHTDQAKGYLVCRSLDQNGNETWQLTLVPGSKAVSRVAMSSSNGALLFVGGTQNYQASTIYQSEDGGKTWRDIFHGPPNYFLFDLAVSGGDPAKVIAVLGQYHPDNLLVYESLDTGKTWRDLTSEMQSVAGNVWTKFTYRAFVFIDGSGATYFVSGDTILAQLSTEQAWEIYGGLADPIYAADIETGSPGSLWLASEKSGWRLPLLLQFFFWMPIISR